MTDIEQAARAEAERRNPLRLPYNAEFERRAQRPDQWEECASWLAEYLLSDENVEKAARATFELGALPGDYTWAEMVAEDPSRADIWREDARKVLQAVLGKEQP